MPRIVVVSDSHLSPAAPHADEQWGIVVDEVARRRPDIVVHAGDLTRDGADDRAELHHARRLIDRLPTPWMAIPGNHDIGDLGDTSHPVDDRRRAAYHDAFGAGRWAVDVDGWHLVGIDIQTMGSDDTDDGWGWLPQVLAVGRPAVLFMHRPLLTHDAAEVDEPRRYVPGTTRRRLLDVMAGADVRVVVSGHVHQWRTARLDGRLHVWSPSTWACVPESVQPTIGAKVTGLVEIELGDEVSTQLIRPPALRDLTIGEDFESPYHE